MLIPATLIASAVSGLVNGPLNKIIESYVSDLELRRKLAAELETNMLTHLGKSLELQQAIVLAEVKSEYWLTRSWRPLLMMLMMSFLVIVGMLLPLADLVAGHSIPFNPRWKDLPDGFWNFLSIGVGGYIGGRSLEKMVGAAASPVSSAFRKLAR
jgi:Holin of 3TMs, for gene-transfer release